MRCLGLLCLTSEVRRFQPHVLYRNMLTHPSIQRFALRFFDTFMREMEEGTIKIIYLHAFFDILTVHGPVIMTVGDNVSHFTRATFSQAYMYPTRR